MLSFCFLSNYLTHHQLPFCLEMMARTGGRFQFVETAPLPQERRAMGYAPLGEQYAFVIRAHASEEQRRLALQAAEDADVVMIGSAPDSYIRRRLKKNNLTFRYSERIFKKGYFDILRQLKYTWKNLPYRNKNMYYLLSSAYAAHDYLRCGVRREKMLKWGYFPEAKVYADPEVLLSQKEPGSILWVARMISWKHPEEAVELARNLRDAGVHFSLKMIGSGPMEQQVQTMIHQYGLDEQVRLLGAVPPEQV